MGLISKTVLLNVVSNKKYYSDIGYDLSLLNIEDSRHQYLEVKTVDLLPTSSVLVCVECDCCKSLLNISYADYNKYNHEGKYYCQHCHSKVFLSGKNNTHWNDKLTKDERLYKRSCVSGYTAWAQIVFMNANYICDYCKQPINNNGEAHHLNSWADFAEQRLDPNNGRCLHSNCHKLFHKQYGFYHNTKEQYEEWIGEKITITNTQFNSFIEDTFKVYCYENNTVYNDANMCAKSLKISPSSVRKVCSNSARTIHGYHLFWYKDYLSMTKEEVFAKVSYRNFMYEKIVLLNTGEIFDNPKLASKKYKLNYCSIQSSCDYLSHRTHLKSSNLRLSSGKFDNGIPMVWVLKSHYDNMTKNEKINRLLIAIFSRGYDIYYHIPSNEYFIMYKHLYEKYHSTQKYKKEDIRKFTIEEQMKIVYKEFYPYVNDELL